ncbi:Scm-like with four MBT domains protein 2 [Liparis tanakae]|uniref:Scm-like with four MBT domains protein 2 n=1 Tax=Liparis tanakae TaxID=230148 RepID=A0A4Z2GWY9_9TELE|nr:Scm-like with four MBT domains protein 2 [Liparis tanakae]
MQSPGERRAAASSAVMSHRPTNGREEGVDTDSSKEEAQEAQEAEFSWEEFLEETRASAAPHTTFKHVSDGVRFPPRRDPRDPLNAAARLSSCAESR